MRRPVDYDEIAADYDGRYDRNQYTGVQRALAAFLIEAPGAVSRRVLEAGCGTGHWVRICRDAHIKIVGVDASAGMLHVARKRLADARLIRARAEALPCSNASFDRVFCVNALHHFSDAAAFFCEAKRVLAEGGGLLTIGLDPHAGLDRWWIYDYFPSALALDQGRYLPAAGIRTLMEAAGLSRCETQVVQHVPMHITVEEAERRGFLNRGSTSQLMVISEGEYSAGLARIRSENRNSNGAMVLRSDLRIYGTTGWAR